MQKVQFFSLDHSKKTLTPYFETRVNAGFASPAEDLMEQKLDLNTFLIKHKEATFFVRVQGDSMQNALIQTGDLLIVDRAITPKNGMIVLAALNGEFTVKRLRKKGEKLFLEAENDTFLPIEIIHDSDFLVWGTVTYIIHKAK
ncbi:MAG: translesion error-prone DNA polymerase V autoproteolytic subunit [Simkaniaceae bacterium]|nr:translesion error-prone DNA polymerase V autoproteolytic subunit [Simkaniaceae bacterium]